MSATDLVMIAGGVAVTAGCTRAAVRIDGRARARNLRPPARVLPAPIRAAFARWIARSDLALTPEAAIGWYLGGIAAAAWLTLVLVPVLVLPAVLAAVVAGPVALHRRAGRNDRAASGALPGILDQVVAHLRAGGTVPDALVTLAGRPGPLAGDLRRVVARVALGASLEESLVVWSAERPVADLATAAGALAMVTTVGGAASTPLEGLAASLRDDEAARGEARALSAQARISALVVGAAPLAYLVFTSASDPASVRVLVSSNAGRVCLVVGLGLETLAAWWMHRLVGTRS